MSWWDALWQGILQGLTEFLPVSSSGHLSLYQHFTGNSGEGALLFTLMLHIGTLIAVCSVFYRDIWAMICEFFAAVGDIFTGQFTFKTDNPHRKLLFMLVLATLPLALMLFFKDFVGGLAQDGDILVEGFSFLLTSALLFLACSMKPGRVKIGRMNTRQALGIGAAQLVATVPGISRSGSTTAAGMIFGLEREFAIKFSFLLGIPAIVGGAVFEVGDALKEGIKLNFGILAIGIIAAAVSGYFCIILLRWLMRTNRFVLFAWYTLALGAIVVMLGLFEHLAGIYLFKAVPPSSLPPVSSLPPASSLPAVSSAIKTLLGQ